MTHSQAYQILGIPHSANADEIKKATENLENFLDQFSYLLFFQ